MSTLRSAAIRLAASNPGPVRDALLPVLQKTAAATPEGVNAKVVDALNQIKATAKAEGWKAEKPHRESAMMSIGFVRGPWHVTVVYWHGKGGYGAGMAFLDVYLGHPSKGDEKAYHFDVSKVTYEGEGHGPETRELISRETDKALASVLNLLKRKTLK